MKNFYEKEEYAFDDIQALIDDDVEESLYLDFKQAGALDRKDNIKRFDISKDVASFANSDGGIIVYGIKEKNHKAESFSFINGNDVTKEWLEQVINSHIQRRIPDLKIFPIRKDGNIEQTVYVVKIPSSVEAPHMSKDNKFYKRYNFESVAMDEYEVRQLYGRKAKSKLLIDSITHSHFEVKDNQLRFSTEIKIYNDGNSYSDSYKTNVYFKNSTGYLNFDWSAFLTNMDYVVLNDNKIKISSVGTVPIYPNETINSIRFFIKIPKNKILEALEGVEIEVRLFYPDGEDKMVTDFDNILKIYDKGNRTLNFEGKIIQL